MKDKLSNWSEGHKRADDSTHSLDPKDAIDLEVSDFVVQRGVVLLTNCQNCGRQWKGVIPWTEVAFFFLGHDVPKTKATRQGVWMGCDCNGCGKTTPVLLDWDEIRRYVEAGIRSGSLDGKIRQARQQR